MNKLFLGLVGTAICFFWIGYASGKTLGKEEIEDLKLEITKLKGGKN